MTERQATVAASAACSWTPRTCAIRATDREVRAILAGDRTQMRVVLKTQPPAIAARAPRSTRRWLPRSANCLLGSFLLPVTRGDRLWVREAFGTLTGNGIRTVYRADGDPPQTHDGRPLLEKMVWRSSVCMPRWQSRITLEVTEARAERLQSIDDHDAHAEGVDDGWVLNPRCETARDGFRELFCTDNGVAVWDANPVVCVVTFRRLTSQGD